MSRRITFTIVFVALLALAMIGASSHLSSGDAESIIERVKAIMPTEPTPYFIFMNNERIALVMLIPILGLILGGFAIYNTGVIFAASGVLKGASGIDLLLNTAAYPFFWLEFLAYAAAMTQCIYLTTGIFRKRIRSELKPTLYTIVSSAALLLLGAWIEAALI